MGALDQLIRRIQPSKLSRAQKDDWRSLTKKVYVPEMRRAEDRMAQFLRAAETAPDEGTREALLRAADREKYKSARFAMMDSAAATISSAIPRVDDGLETMFLTGGEKELPVGIANFYKPGRYMADDPELNSAGYLEQLAATGEVPGTGRSLLYSMGQDMQEDPIMWLSLPYADTMDFYKSRGAELYSPKAGSQLTDRNYPVFRVERGDLIKKKRGGLVQYCDRCNHG
jgi:hypothetical protein